jgi:SPP1 gp7 family putative phage head morphogenesis protein
MSIIPLRKTKAGPIGSGAGVLMTEYNLGISGALKRSTQDQMRDAARLAVEVSWIRAAERAICGPASSVEWHIEDPDGETVDENYPSDAAVELYHLVCKPQEYGDVFPRQTRRAFWYRTLHHMGVCGPAFWYRDQRDTYGIPRAYLYIRPDRLTPIPDEQGNLSSWMLDADAGRRSGTKLAVEDIVQFDLEPPDDGFLPWGLVKSAMTKITMTQGLDRHVASVLASGGRLSGIMSPKTGTIDDDNIFQQIIRDWRNIAEQPEAAKRLQVVRYPIEFTQTATSLRDLDIVKLLTDSRDELLELWGVPLSQIGGSPAAGLNSGGVREYDRQALWENAIHPRLAAFSEVLQGEIDRWEPLLGWKPKITLTEPSFTNDSPRFDLLAKSLNLPMRNRERRDLIGLDPFGEKVIGPSGGLADDEVWLPQGIGLGLAFAAPEDGIADQPMMVMGGTPEQAKQETEAKEAPVLKEVAKAKLDQAQFVKVVLSDLSHQYPPKLTEWVKSLTWEYDEAVKVKSLESSGGSGKKPEVVAAIGLSIGLGAPVDPLVAVQFPDSETLLIANGDKRYMAAVEQGVKRLPCYIGTASIGNEATIRKAITAMQDPAYQKAGLNPKSTNLRENVVRTMQPKFIAAAKMILGSQKREIVARVRSRAEHILGHPSDVSAWWDGKHWDDAFLEAMHPQYQAVANKVVSGIRSKAMPLSLGPLTPVDPAIIKRVLELAGTRITGINETTLAGIRELIAEGISDGLSPAQLGDLIEAWSGFDEYRAERIATTELATTYNQAAISTYREDGITQLQAIDGDEDEECAARDGQLFDVDEAEAIEDHPNGTLDWVPIVDENAALGDLEGKATTQQKAAELLSQIAADEDAGKERTVRLVESFTQALVAESQRPVIVQPARVTVNIPPPANRRVVRDAEGRISGTEVIPNG